MKIQLFVFKFLVTNTNMLSRIITRGVRKFGTVADFETTATSSEQVGNTFVKTTRYIKQTYDSTSNATKFTLWSWLGGMPIYNGIMTFNAGNAALHRHRAEHGINLDAEYQIVYETCKSTMYRELLSSIIWPGTLISNGAPFLVTWVNRPSKQIPVDTSNNTTNEQGEE